MNKRLLLLAVGFAVTTIAAVTLVRLVSSFFLARPRDPFLPKLDGGTYLLAATEAASQQYAEAVAEARKLHPGAAECVFQPADLRTVTAAFKKAQPRFALVFVLPEELDVNFAWRWLQLTTQVDDDPFVDVRTGFITGESPGAAADFVRRIRSAVESRTPLMGLALDNLGPNTMAAKSAFHRTDGNFMIPVLGERVALSTISHGAEGFTQSRLASMSGATIIHFGGHGYPDRVQDGLTSALVRQLKLSPCVIFNGACYTGVTGRWFDWQTGGTERRVAPSQSFCLALLANHALGYLAALHPDHGIPVYQEMEFLATDGAPLGDLIKHTQDGIILGAGGRLPDLDSLAPNVARPRTPSEMMLSGTASRVLFGDPALVLTPAFTAPPFEIRVGSNEPNALDVTAVLTNDKLKATFTDTYHADLSSEPNLFNDRALISFALPPGWDTVSRVDIVRVTAKAKSLKARLVAFGVENDSKRHVLHVQVDVPTTGYMQSEFRISGASVELKVQR